VAVIVAVWPARGLIGHAHALESRPDRGCYGPLSVLAGQPDLRGSVGQRLPGRCRIEVSLGDQLTDPQAGPEQEPVPFPALRGLEPPDDPVQPGLLAPAAVAGPGTGRWHGGRPGQGGDPCREERQLARLGPDRIPRRPRAGATATQFDGAAARQRAHAYRAVRIGPVPQVPPGKVPAVRVARGAHRHRGGQVKQPPDSTARSLSQRSAFTIGAPSAATGVLMSTRTSCP